MMKLVLIFSGLAAGAFAIGFDGIGIELLVSASVVYAASLLPGITRRGRSYERGSAADELYRHDLRDGDDV